MKLAIHSQTSLVAPTHMRFDGDQYGHIPTSSLSGNPGPISSIKRWPLVQRTFCPPKERFFVLSFGQTSYVITAWDLPQENTTSLESTAEEQRMAFIPYVESHTNKYFQNHPLPSRWMLLPVYSQHFNCLFCKQNVSVLPEPIFKL